jgi:hypothetical protein
MVGFGQYLRLHGLNVGPAHTIAFVQAIQQVGFARDDFRLAARATFVSRKEDLHVFDAAFDRYWRTKLAPSELQPQTPCNAQQSQWTDLPMFPTNNALEVRPPLVEMAASGAEERSETTESATDAQTTYSTLELLYEKDFGHFSDDEITQAEKLMRLRRWQFGNRVSRRTIPAARGSYLDMRHFLRSSLGDHKSLRLAWSKRKLRPRPMIAICDISGSMDRYTRLLLQFLHIVAQGRDPLEVFVFGTRLTYITRQLRSRDVKTALDSAAREVTDWSGGTRIGECIHTFNKRWSQRMLRRGAVVLIISDGWDRGDPHLLGAEVARLQRNAHRLIWLNPLLGSPGYAPMTRGIMAALPYLDDFLPVHNLKSLDDLATILATIGDKRMVRSGGHRREPLLAR